ncbi:hypothetical protein RB195_021121 [Necator americanus]|uniref:Uncharacterized protein n=1 Tax=Necator americanus TaxID=51031 RepID=A0ABR1E9T5_NECAM
MSFYANTPHKQLYTKRSFVKVKDGDKLVRVLRRNGSPSVKQEQRRLIRLIPVDFVEGPPLSSQGTYGKRTKTSSQHNPQKRKNPDGDVFGYEEDDEALGQDYKTFIERVEQDKSIMEKNVENIREKTHVIPAPQQRSSQSAEDETISAIKEGLQILLHGQQEIGSRLDSLQKEQLKSKVELEDGMANFMEKLKSDIVEKTLDQTEELEKFRIKQQDLYSQFGFLNLRLDELERLVANLLHETKDDPHVIIKLDKPAEIEEITRSESLQSVLSISSGSTVEDPSSQQKKTRKPSQAFLYTQNIEDPQKGVRKGEFAEVTQL